jgi:hypothetical protein
MSRFGDHILTPQLLWKSMEGVREPMTNISWVALLLVTISIITPLVPESEPPFNTDETGNAFLYPPATVNGLPWWAFKILLLSVLPTIYLLVSVYQSPSVFPIDRKKIETEGVDPDLVELTPKEMGRRSSYDEKNVLIHRRRSTISQTMEELGMKSGQMEEVPTSQELNMVHKRLSRLILKGEFDTIEETDDDKNIIIFDVNGAESEQSVKEEVASA